MENSATMPSPDKPRPELHRRLFWFVAGSGVNYLLIATPFKWLSRNTALPNWAIAACSLAISTSFFFCWNYFVNFRTDSRKRDALTRYIGAVALMFLLSWSLLTLLKRQDFLHKSFPLDLDVIATQFFLAGLKFLLYHKWVFPAPAPAEADA